MSLLRLILLGMAAVTLAPSIHAFGTFGDYPYATGAMFGNDFNRAPLRHTGSRRAAPPALPLSGSTNSRMLKAGQIAEQRAERRSTRLCWRYVKTALLQAGAVSSYPSSSYAKDAGRDLVRNGFSKLSVRNPNRAPLGSVLVYGGRGAGHVEIRTRSGYVSDFKSRWPVNLPLLGVYAKAA